jgi:hypothetical protein
LRLIVPAIRRLSSYLVEIGMARKLFLSGAGANNGLLTRIAATVNASLCTPTKS